MIEGNEWFSDRSSSFFVALDKASKFVDEQINDMRYRYNIDTEDIVLVGLSDGGMLALYTAITARYKLGGIIVTAQLNLNLSWSLT